MTPLPVTASTLVTALGAGRSATLNALRAERSGLAPARFLDVPLTTYTGEVDAVDTTPLPPELREFDWVLFTSANGVLSFTRALSRAGLDARAFANAKIGAIGPKTGAALESFGLRADLTADEFIGSC